MKVHSLQSIIHRVLFGAMVCALLCARVSAAQAATYYVSINTGSDSNPGTSAQPFKTIVYAYSLATPGTTIIVMPGTYTEYQNIDGGEIEMSKSGTVSQPITLRSQVRRQAILDGQNSSNRRLGVQISGNYNILDGFEIKQAYVEGVIVWGNNNQVINNEIHHNGNLESDTSYAYHDEAHDGIFSYRTFSYNSYMGNYIHHNGRQGSTLDHGMYLCGSNESVINNIVTYNAANGLQIAGYTTVNNMRVYNNVFGYNGTRHGIIIWQAMNGVEIKNNIFYRNGQNGISSWDAHGSGVVVDHNIFFGNSSGTYNLTDGGSDYTYTLGTNIFADPLFVNPPTDFHLQSNSPAINAGLAFSLVTTDFDGITRPQGSAWDIGAYEYVSPYGDVSGDGRVSAYDAALVGQYAVSLITLTPEQITRADVSGGGGVSAYDAALIVERAVGLISKFPVEG